jgi:hypothetical protein
MWPTKASLDRVPANIGKRVPLVVEQSGASYSARNTQLISARDSAPRQWLVTVMQATTQAKPGSPWAQNWDGTGFAFPIVPPLYFGAPVLTGAGVGADALSLKLRWGAGGASFETSVDYPTAGATFGLVADTVDVDVVPRGPLTFASAPLVPIVGAFMGPGIAADPTPLRWLDRPSGLLSTAGTAVAYWSIKPFARRVRVELLAAAAANNVDVAWYAADGSLLSLQRVSVASPAGTTLLVDVPAQAAVLGVQNNTAPNVNARVEWYIGLV